MRMWGIKPECLCAKHLIGEHGEIHKHRHNFVKRHSIKNRITPVVQIEPENMGKRHDELAKEMVRRGYNHNSPYEQPDLSHLRDEERYAKISIGISISDLKSRCKDCSDRITSKYF